MDDLILELYKERAELDHRIFCAHAKKATAKKRERKSEAEPVEPTAKKREEVFECAGNLRTGEACTNTDLKKERAQDTKHNGKNVPTCKECKRAMARAKAKEKKNNHNSIV